jgi:hypothetical protein
MSSIKSGGFSDSKYLGNPAKMADRQFASSGAPGYDTPGDIANDMPGPTADIYMVPDFQGQSGQGANQSTDRPMGSS